MTDAYFTDIFDAHEFYIVTIWRQSKTDCSRKIKSWCFRSKERAIKLQIAVAGTSSSPKPSFTVFRVDLEYSTIGFSGLCTCTESSPLYTNVLDKNLETIT